MAASVTKVYLGVIQDVVDKVRRELEEEGKSEDASALQELQELWQKKMFESGAVPQLAGAAPPQARGLLPAVLGDLNQPSSEAPRGGRASAGVGVGPEEPDQDELSLAYGSQLASSSAGGGQAGLLGLEGKPQPYMAPPGYSQHLVPGLADLKPAHAVPADHMGIDINAAASRDGQTQASRKRARGDEQAGGREGFAGDGGGWGQWGQQEQSGYIPQTDGAHCSPERAGLELASLDPRGGVVQGPVQAPGLLRPGIRETARGRTRTAGTRESARGRMRTAGWAAKSQAARPVAEGLLFPAAPVGQGEGGRGSVQALPQVDGEDDGEDEDEDNGGGEDVDDEDEGAEGEDEEGAGRLDDEEEEEDYNAPTSPSRGDERGLGSEDGASGRGGLGRSEAEDDEETLGAADDDEEEDEESRQMMEHETGAEAKPGKVQGNLVLALHDKVTRTKARWKCVLSSGVMHFHGRDYLFNRANGEFEF